MKKYSLAARVAALFPVVLLCFVTSALAQTNVTHYAVKGIFKESRDAGHQAVIKHEAIPGYMMAMTMPFTVKHPEEIKTLTPGDQITFRLNVTDSDDWIDEIQKTGTNVPAAAPMAAMKMPERFQELKIGDLLPDATLTNQSGGVIHLKDFRGQALGFTFFFTRCPLPTYCPRMNQNLEAVQAALRENPARTNWQLLSISFDPEFDTPQHLASYAQTYHPDPRHWNFATTSPQEIQRLAAVFDLMVLPNGGTITHNLRTVVVDASGRVQKIFTDNGWTPEEFTAAMKQAMEVRP